MSSGMSDRELRAILRSLPEAPVPAMPRLMLPPRPVAVPSLPTWILWFVGAIGLCDLVAGGMVSWWLLHGGIGVLIADLAAVSVQRTPEVAKGLGFLDAALAGTLIALVLSTNWTVLVRTQR